MSDPSSGFSDTQLSWLQQVMRVGSDQLSQAVASAAPAADPTSGQADPQGDANTPAQAGPAAPAAADAADSGDSNAPAAVTVTATAPTDPQSGQSGAPSGAPGDATSGPTGDTDTPAPADPPPQAAAPPPTQNDAAATWSFSPTIPAAPDIFGPAARAATEKFGREAQQADAWVETYLKGNDLAPDPADDGSGKSVLFDGKSTATATAIDTAVAAGQLANLEGGDSARAHITTDSVARIVSRVLDAAKTPPPATQPATDDPEQKGVLEAGSDGIATSAKITFKSKDDGHSLGDLEFTVHLGPDGTLKQFEVDQTLIKGKLSDGMSRMRSKLLGMGALMPLEIEATLSGNATNDVTGDSQHTMFNTINVQLKGEIDASFGNAKTGAVFAHLKFGASFGTGGFAPSIGFEFPLPDISR